MINDFQYAAPKTVKEALGMLDQYREDYKIIAGGQSLLIMLKQGLVQPHYLVDIKGISELDYVRFDANNELRIGALTTHATIEESPVIRESFPVLAEMEKRLASVQTRNWGSIGGNLCHGDPAGDPAPILIALNATLTVVGIRGERKIRVEDFFRDYFETALKPGELLTEIQIPALPARTGIAYTKFNVIENDMAVVGAAVSITVASGGTGCEDLRIVLGNAAPTPIRAKKAEDLLRGKTITSDLLKKAGEIASTESDPITDIHASADYRRDLVKILVERMGMEALSRAKAPDAK